MHETRRNPERGVAPSRPPVVLALDANALDPPVPDRDRLVADFRKRIGETGMTVVVTASVREELLRPETPAAVRALVQAGPPPPRTGPTHEQKLDRLRVRAILRGDAPSAKHEADALHLSEAAEAGCAVFITHDRRILRRRDDLRVVLPKLRITTLEAFLRTAASEDASPAHGHGPD